LFRSIDGLIERVHRYQTPDFLNERGGRDSWAPNFGERDSGILQRCITLIAYSQQAKSRLVDGLMERGVLDRMFHGYDVAQVANLSSDRLYAEFWDEISCIRWPAKIEAMINCARSLQTLAKQHSSFMNYLASRHLPTVIHSEADVRAFWERFERVRQDLIQVGMPFFQNLTSLCHLLQFLGYACVKPDSAVMKAGTKLGIVLGKTEFRDREKRRVIETMQRFCASRRMRVPVLDLYFLIGGEQTGAQRCVRPEFYPWP
jgi:3-methyladenine DNA glycosylase Tag